MTLVIAGSPALVAGILISRLGAVDDLPQLDRLGDRAVGVVGQARIDLDRHPPVDAVGLLVHRREDVAGVAYVVGGDRADGAVDIGTACGQFGDLCVVGGALRQCGLEDRRVGGHADHRLRGDQFGEITGADQVPGQVVQPHRDTGGGQFGELLVLGHDFSPWFVRLLSRR